MQYEHRAAVNYNRPVKTFGLMMAIWLVAGCSGLSDGEDGLQVAVQSIQIVEALGGLEFNKPVALVFLEDSDVNGYVVEQPGRIVAVSEVGESWSAKELLNIEGRVNDLGREEGLLGLALDQEFESSGYVYVNYTASGPRRTVVSRFSVSPNDHSVADAGSEMVILEVGQPYSNHNGGHLQFGPDGFMYIGLGDGGSAGDPRRNGQNMGTLLGSMVRIDVSNLDESGTYAIPGDNPFVQSEGARSEIWAYGLRNPWRYSFDRVTGELWAADVGQNEKEEVNLIQSGLNYGWNIMEGTACYGSRSDGCDQEGLESPILEYGREDGCSVTGGYVYRGRGVSWLIGKYIYGDFCSGKIWSLDRDTGQTAELIDSRLKISSFAEDPLGELYVLSLDGGVYAIVDSGSSSE